MNNPYCKHKMVRSVGKKKGLYPGQVVYYCPHGWCQQWFAEYTRDLLELKHRREGWFKHSYAVAKREVESLRKKLGL